MPASPTRVGDVSPRRAPFATVKKTAPPPASPLVFDDGDLSSKRYTTEFDLVYQPGGGQGFTAKSTAAISTPPRSTSTAKGPEGQVLSRGQSTGNITLQERRAPSREIKPAVGGTSPSRQKMPSPRRAEANSVELEGTYPPTRLALNEHVLRPRTAGTSRPRARRHPDGGPRSRDESPNDNGAAAVPPPPVGTSLPPVGKQSPAGIRRATPHAQSARGVKKEGQFELGGDYGPSRQGKGNSTALSRSGSRSRVADVLRRTGVDSEGVLAIDDDDEDDLPEGSPRAERPNFSPPEGEMQRREMQRASDPAEGRRRSPSSILRTLGPNDKLPAPAAPIANSDNIDDAIHPSKRPTPAPLASSTTPAVAVAAPSPQHHTRIEIGMMIRHWVVTSRIGAGSFGETFCAAEVPEAFDLELYEKCVEEATKKHHLSCTFTGGGLTTLGASRGSDSDMDDSVGGGGEPGAGRSPVAYNLGGLGKAKAVTVPSMPGASGMAPPSGSDDGDDAAGPNESSVSHEVIDGSSQFDRPQFDRPLQPLHDQAKSAISLEALGSMPDNMRPVSEVCIKVEQDSKNVLRLEVVSLKKSQPCSNVVRYVGSGHIDAPLSVNYLVMEKLGPNLAELRRQCPHQLFDIYTTLYTGISCLESLRGVHDLGLVHRDVKPSNFVVGLGPERSRVCYLIDFGLARRFKRSNGGMRPPRDNAGFRGTNRYASIQSHLHQELGRVDDLWSLLFMLVEFATGSLPWRKYKEKEAIGECKQQTVNADLVRTLPREFLPFLEHLQTLSYAGEPDYDYLIGLLKTSIVRRGYAPDRLLDWEKYAGECLQLDDVAGRTLPLPLVIKPLTSLPVSNGQHKAGADAAAGKGGGDEGSDVPPAVEPPKKKNPHSWAARARSEAEENLLGGADTPRPREHPITGVSTLSVASLPVPEAAPIPAAEEVAGVHSPLAALLHPPQKQSSSPSNPLPPPPAESATSPPMDLDMDPLNKIAKGGGGDALKDSLMSSSPPCFFNVPADDISKGSLRQSPQLGEGAEGRETPTRPTNDQRASIPVAPLPLSNEDSPRRSACTTPSRENPLQQQAASSAKANNSLETSDANLNVDGTSPSRTPASVAHSISQNNFGVAQEESEGAVQDGGGGGEEGGVANDGSDEPPVVGASGRNRRAQKGLDDTVNGGCCDKGCTVQ